MKTILSLLLVAGALTPAFSGYIPEPRPVKSAVEITALYYPGTEHRPEWDMVEQVLPQIRPLLGWYDEGDPENIDWQIKWAVEHGIGSFCVDWYWNRGVQRLDHWVKGFYKAKFRKYLKWYVMYANHDQPGSHSTEEQIRLTRFWIDNYFKTPEYYTVDGRPAVVIWSRQNIDRDFIAEAAAKGETLRPGEGVRRAFAISERLAKEAGLPGIFWINMNNAWRHDPAQTEVIHRSGFEAQMSYNLGGSAPYYMAREGRLPKDTAAYASFDVMCAAAKKLWSNADVDPAMPFWPLIPTGWNDLPRSFQRSRVTYGRTPEKFAAVCAAARAFCERKGLTRVVIAPLNEWQEGSYIEPNEEYGFTMYDALRDAFCEKPAEGWPRNLTPQDLGRPLREFPPMRYAEKPSWTFDGSTEGWYRQPYGCPVTLCRDGALNFVTTRDNNFNIRQRLKPFDPKTHRTFRLRMRITPNSAAGIGEAVARDGARMRLKWGTVDTPVIGAFHAVDFENYIATAPVLPDGRWHEYTIDLSLNRFWSAPVNELWFEAVNMVHAVVDIDWMRFE